MNAIDDLLTRGRAAGTDPVGGDRHVVLVNIDDAATASPTQLRFATVLVALLAPGAAVAARQAAIRWARQSSRPGT